MPLSFEQRVECIRTAIRALLGNGYNDPGWTIVATFEDSVVVSRGPGKLTEYPATVSAAGDCKLGAPRSVEVVYQHLLAESARFLGPLPLSEAEQAQLSEAATEGAPAKPRAGGRWAVRVIEEGVSQNRVDYPGNVLRRAAPLYEGAKCFMNHATAPGQMRSPRDLVGRIRKPRYALMEATGKGAIYAELTAMPELHTRLLEAFAEGEPDLFGLSHEAEGATEKVRMPEGWMERATVIDRVKSVDVVSFPAAGGAFTRLVAGMPTPVSTLEDFMRLDELLALIALRPELHARLGENPTEAHAMTLLREAVVPPAVSRETVTAPAPTPAAVPPVPAAPATPDAGATRLSEADRSLLSDAQALVAEMRAQNRRLLIESTVAGVQLPPAALTALRESLDARPTLTEADARAVAAAKVAEVAKLLEGLVGYGSGMGGHVSAVPGGDFDQKAVARVYDIFMGDCEGRVLVEAEKLLGRKVGQPDNYSLKDAYREVTGDGYFHGQRNMTEGLRPMARLTSMMRDPARFCEGRRMCEGLGMTTTWAELQQDAMHVRLLAEYRAQGLDDWRKVTNVVNKTDTKLEHAVRWGGYSDSDIAVVLEGAAYPEANTPTDEEVTYTMTKKGVTEFVTVEAMINDRLQQIRNIPIKLGRAAARKLYKYVLYDLLASNPVMPYDSVALFNAAHGNYTTSALDEESLEAASRALLTQTEFGAGADVIGLRLAWLMIPPALRQMAWRLLNSPVAVTSGQTATEPNPHPGWGLAEIIINPYLTDANNWFAGCAKGDAPMIELAFLYGQQEPVLVVADAPTVGDYFRSDRIGHKLRHWYGGAPVDHRGLFGAFVPA